MRPQNKQRSRNKPGGNGGHQNNQQRQQRMGNIINRVFESAGPDGKVRGTPQQIIDKYQALARDAQVSGDRVAAESYLQHSEHYSRLLGEAQRQQMETRLQQQDREDGQQQQPRGDDGYERERRPQPAVVPVASGLTMIDPDEPDYPGGPIETPEGRTRRRSTSRRRWCGWPRSSRSRGPRRSAAATPSRPRRRRPSPPPSGRGRGDGRGPTRPLPRRCPSPSDRQRPATSRLRRQKPSSGTCSARSVGRIPAAASSASTSGPSGRRLARSILRRCPKASATTRASTAGSAG